MERSSTKDIVKRHNFKFSKKLGQNFLIDNNILGTIIEASNINKDDIIVEIGPGVGTLTRELLKLSKKVYSIELDSELIPILKEELKDYSNFELIHKDALKVNYSEIIKEGSTVKIVANLPYYITTPIICKFLLENLKFKSLIIMIQKEVAERIVACPNCKEYGSLSILVQYYCNARIITKVLPHSFIPQPKVESMVIKLDKLSEPKIKVKDEKLFFKIIRQSFNMRRKTLRNVLKSLKFDKELIEKVFTNSNIDPRRRGETLSIEEFRILSDSVWDLIN